MNLDILLFLYGFPCCHGCGSSYIYITLSSSDLSLFSLLLPTNDDMSVSVALL